MHQNSQHRPANFFMGIVFTGIVFRGIFLGGIVFISIVLTGTTLSASPQSQLDTAGDAAVDRSQDLALFEPVETPANQNRPVAREATATTAEPEFTLSGVSRIAGNYSAILEHKSGESILVKVAANANTRIPEYSDYSIVSMSAVTVSIRYPGNNPCAEFADQGVRCNRAANIAELSLSHGDPIPATNPADTESAGTDSEDESAIDNADNGDNANNGEARNGSRNPFATLANAKNGASGDNSRPVTASGAGRRFTPRRISPEDVPEGKRLVTTPFGDRLVDQ